ncbi:hypothetical protein AMR72_02080 [Flavobacterium psychrophilum]|nr:hypothetical protein AMR72_02080 [Flavobacterium psychrophilum]AOE51416.1 hypothetical protein ALW18_02080 [Flavobacterium psychrophilum]
MEEKSHFDSFELQFTNEAKDYLAIAGKWATFLSIIGFIGLGFMVIGALAMFSLGSALGSMAGGGAMGMMSGGVLGGIYLVFAVLGFFPTLYLFKFGSKAKQAVNNSTTAELTESLGNLKSYFKFLGIFTIIIIVFYIIAAIAAVAIGASAAAGM